VPLRPGGEGAAWLSSPSLGPYSNRAFDTADRRLPLIALTRPTQS
jgi:hypothetical protein